MALMVQAVAQGAIEAAGKALDVNALPPGLTRMPCWYK